MNPAAFLSPRALEVIKTTGLHKMAAALEHVATGRDKPAEITFASAVQLLGEKLYEKRAAYNKITKGLQAFRALRGE